MHKTANSARRRFLQRTALGATGLTAAACGGGGGDPAPTPAPTTAPTPAPTPGPTPAPTPAPTGTVIQANSTNYLSKIPLLRPGDTLLLAAGNYGVDANGGDTGDPPGLPLFGLNGTANAPITISGPATGARPVFMGRDTHNTIRLDDSSYVVIRRVEVDGRAKAGFGVAAQGPTHHITIEDSAFRALAGTGTVDDQQIVAISTTGTPTWGWIIRRNVIEGAGTGIYLGDSNGGSPFVDGLIEYNLIRDTMGYNIQVKHQIAWSAIPAGMPTGKTTTVIRYNVFAKSANSSTGAYARPNLLVGDSPPSGPGSSNGFVIYGNFFYGNPTEALFQGEGNVALYNNVMVTTGPTVNVHTHNGSVRDIRIFNNTVVAGGSGIALSGGVAGYTQRVLANAVFAGGIPIAVSGTAATATGNVTDTRANAPSYLNNPLAAVGNLDVYPKVGTLKQAAADLAGLDVFADWNSDFNRATKDATFRGAYSGEGGNPGWTLALAIRP